MATPIWPSTLPQCPLLEGLSGKQRDTVIRTPNATGVAKTRRRSTLTLEDNGVSYKMNLVQYKILKEFFNTDCNGGSTSFMWPMPPDYDSVEARFLDTISKAKVGEDTYIVALKIEEI